MLLLTLLMALTLRGIKLGRRPQIHTLVKFLRLKILKRSLVTSLRPAQTGSFLKSTCALGKHFTSSHWKFLRRWNS